MEKKFSGETASRWKTRRSKRSRASLEVKFFLVEKRTSLWVSKDRKEAAQSQEDLDWFTRFLMPPGASYPFLLGRPITAQHISESLRPALPLPGSINTMGWPRKGTTPSLKRMTESLLH